MSGAQLVAAGGMLLTTGGCLAVAALRPAPPQLAAALAQVSAPPTPAAAAPSVRDRWGFLPPAAAAFLDAHLGVPDADLEIIGWTRAQLAARKLTTALVGLVLPPAVLAGLALMGLGLPVAVPAGLGLAAAAWLWTVPSGEAKEKATAARAEFRAALASFLDLVALERVARGSVVEALEAAAEISTSPPFTRIHTALTRAELAGVSPWTALRDLGAELGVDELRNLADIVAVAADGAAVYDTLLAESRSLRHAELAAHRAAANIASEKLVYPLALLGIAFMLLVFVPAALRLFTA